jgi:hypothetical protein
MRKKIFFICLFTFSLQFLHAQNFHAGVIGGISTTQVAGDQLSGFNKLGIIAGGFVNKSFTDKTGMQMEIIFIQKGSRKPVDANNNNVYYVMRVSYFEVPLLFKWQAAQKFNIELGPSFGTLVFSEEETEFGSYEPVVPFKKFDFSGNVGLSYTLSEKLTVNVRLSNSIIPIRDFASGYSFAFFDRGQYNTVLAFTLHCEF